MLSLQSLRKARPDENPHLAQFMPLLNQSLGEVCGSPVACPQTIWSPGLTNSLSSKEAASSSRGMSGYCWAAVKTDTAVLTSGPSTMRPSKLIVASPRAWAAS